MDVKPQIRTFIMSRLGLHGDISPLSDAEALFSSARLDSLDAVELVIFLETEFGIDFARLGFDLTLLDSVGAITALAAGQGNPARAAG